MGMTFEYKVDSKNRFKFERSGFFGKGDKVKCYLNGEYVDEFYLSDWVLEALKDKDLPDSNKYSSFKADCHNWIAEYGNDLLE